MCFVNVVSMQLLILSHDFKFQFLFCCSCDKSLKFLQLGAKRGNLLLCQAKVKLKLMMLFPAAVKYHSFPVCFVLCKSCCCCCCRGANCSYVHAQAIMAHCTLSNMTYKQFRICLARGRRHVNTIFKVIDTTCQGK